MKKGVSLSIIIVNYKTDQSNFDLFWSYDSSSQLPKLPLSRYNGFSFDKKQGTLQLSKSKTSFSYRMVYSNRRMGNFNSHF